MFIDNCINTMLGILDVLLEPMENNVRLLQNVVLVILVCMVADVKILVLD